MYIIFIKWGYSQSMTITWSFPHTNKTLMWSIDSVWAWILLEKEFMILMPLLALAHTLVSKNVSIDGDIKRRLGWCLMILLYPRSVFRRGSNICWDDNGVNISWDCFKGFNSVYFTFGKVVKALNLKFWCLLVEYESWTASIGGHISAHNKQRLDSDTNSHCCNTQLLI